MKYYNYISKLILEEIEETDEFNLKFIIPFFQKDVLKRDIKTPLDSCESNFEIPYKDWQNLNQCIQKLLKEKQQLALFKYVGEGGKGYKWNDGLDLLTNKETELVLNKKRNWVLKKGDTLFYIAERSIGNDNSR